MKMAPITARVMISRATLAREPPTRWPAGDGELVGWDWVLLISQRLSGIQCFSVLHLGCVAPGNSRMPVAERRGFWYNHAGRWVSPGDGTEYGAMV